MCRFAVLLVLVTVTPCLAQSPTPRSEAADPWFSTFSIVAFDPTTNELGVGVQSRAFGAGAAVPYAEPGVGAVATQASANRQYGPKAMVLLKQGLSPTEVVKRITEEPKIWKPQAAQDAAFAKLKDSAEFKRLITP